MDALNEDADRCPPMEGVIKLQVEFHGALAICPKTENICGVVDPVIN